MKCVYCGQERDSTNIHYCYGNRWMESQTIGTGHPPKEPNEVQAIEAVCLVLRDILAELQKFNKPVEIDDIPDRIKALQMLYDDNKEGK